MNVLPLCGHGAVARALRHRVGVLAGTWRPALIAGPFGAGQTEVARALHDESRRARAPFVQIDCAALPPMAPVDFVIQAGRAAGEGTLCLAWVEALLPRARDALIAAVDEGAFQPGMPVRARLVGTTADRAGLPKALDRVFAEAMTLPPLSARRADLSMLVVRILTSVPDAAEDQADAGTLAWLAAQDWPGDLTELAALVATVAASGMPLTPALLSAVRRRPGR